LTVLNDRERRIFEARRLADEPITLEELADEFGVSRERVRQIEVRAFEKVQKAVLHLAVTTEGPGVLAALNVKPTMPAIAADEWASGDEFNEPFQRRMPRSMPPSAFRTDRAPGLPWSPRDLNSDLAKSHLVESNVAAG
jgi:hypothetical protein